MMITTNKYLFIPFIVSMAILISSCNKPLEEPTESVTENVNGFNVIWRSQISDKQITTIRNILEDMVLVEGGYVVIGATPEQLDFARQNEWPTMYVNLSNYYICKHEVTDEEFNTIMGRTVSSTIDYASHITFQEWQAFINTLNDLTSMNFNFPTEAQWEYAARGGRASQHFVYPGSNDWKDICSGSIIHGSTKPNELGIYNMGDLKSEWCLDYYNTYYSNSIVIDWIQTTGKYHVVRGGNYRCTIETKNYNSKNINSSYYRLGYGTTLVNSEMDYRNCRITSRSYHYDDGSSANIVGLRLAVNPTMN